MVKLVIGRKGSGKTKKMVEYANDCTDSAKGSIVFINKDSSLTTNLRYSIRVISMDDYPDLTDVDEFIGFLYGIISQDHDIELFFLDSVLKLADINTENLEEFLARVDKISSEHDIQFVVSVSGEKENLGSYIDKYEEITL